MSNCGCCNQCHHEAFLQRAAVANGNGDVFDVLGYPAVSFQVYGTIAGGTDVEFQFLSGLSTWLPLPVTNASTGVASSTGIVSAAGTYIANTAGLQKVRAVVSGYGGADSINVVATAVCEAGSAAASGGGASDVTVVGPFGQEPMATSFPVVIASDQSAIPVTVSTLPAATTVPVQVTKTVAASGTPEALAADGTFFLTATLIGKRSARVNNTSSVFLGIGSGNDTQALEISPGEVVQITASDGQRYDLNDWYLDVVTNADGVIIIYS